MILYAAHAFEIIDPDIIEKKLILEPYRNIKRIPLLCFMGKNEICTAFQCYVYLSYISEI